jgi:chaperonin cofactor prefoldin
LCGKKLDQRTAKNGKPYFMCDPCGTQFFVRRRHGIEKLAELVRNLSECEIPIRRHAHFLYEIRAILSEIEGLEAEIRQLDSQVGIFVVDEEKVRARKLLKTRVETLLLDLARISTRNEINNKEKIEFANGE